MADSWSVRQYLFQVGKRYIVKINFTSALSQFEEGEVLIYQKVVYSRYDGCYVYEFAGAGGESKSWWLGDDDPASSWKSYFGVAGLFG